MSIGAAGTRRYRDNADDDGANGGRDHRHHDVDDEQAELGSFPADVATGTPASAEAELEMQSLVNGTDGADGSVVNGTGKKSPPPPPPPPPSPSSGKALAAFSASAVMALVLAACLFFSQQSAQTATQSSGSQTNNNDGAPFVPEVERPGYKRNPRQYSYSYVPRRRGISTLTNESGQHQHGVDEALADKWGAWSLVDSKADRRPYEDFFAAYPHRDIPWQDLPSAAWQVDTSYVEEFLKQGVDLVDRSMEAILGEYGHSKFDEPSRSFEERSEMFQLTMTDLENEDDGNRRELYTGNDNGGWTTERSYKSLVRRLLHAIVTEDSFTFTMGGHSAAAGHGNHFQQSYTLQVQRVLEPVFARLGVLFEAHNIGMGGLGTIQNGMASGDVYGREVDVLMWDSSMTEKELSVYDVFARQGLMAGNRVPILLGGGPNHLAHLFLHGEVEVGDFGGFQCCQAGLKKTESDEQALELPWATRYVLCDKDDIELCTRNEHKYNATCWIDRPDVSPLVEQREKPGSQVSWHPGNRSHQLAGRSIAFTLLLALRDALKQWQTAEGYALSDNEWHMSEQYENTRSKVMAMGDENMPCLDSGVPESFCRYPVNGRSEFTPRINPMESSIRSIVFNRDGDDRLMIDPAPANEYDPPDLPIPNMEVPDGIGAVDYLAIIENGVEYAPNRSRRKSAEMRKRQIGREFKIGHTISDIRYGNGVIEPGLGWHLYVASATDFCDGSYDSFCRRANTDCLLSGHNDHRGGLFFDGLSGWLVMKLSKVRYGTIVVKIESWHGAEENPKTEGWTCVNNDCGVRESDVDNGASAAPGDDSADEDGNRLNRLNRRRLKNDKKVSDATGGHGCSDFEFEYAIDGKVTTLSESEFEALRYRPKRNIDLWTLLEDPDYVSSQSSDGEQSSTKDVEVAIRMVGCGREKTMLLTHVYWH